MNREEYLRLLAVSLNHIPQAEKEEAIRYYNDYFDDAGTENEQEVIKTLGSPASLAESIEKEFASNETGFRKPVNAGSTDDALQKYSYDNQGKKQKKKMSTGMIVLVVILLILASPVIVALGGCALGIVVAIFCALFGVIVALISLVCVCVALAAAIGLVSPFSAVTLTGIGLFTVGICIFLVMAVIWVLGVAIPWLIRQIVKLCKKIFGRKGAAAL